MSSSKNLQNCFYFVGNNHPWKKVQRVVQVLAISKRELIDFVQETLPLHSKSSFSRNTWKFWLLNYFQPPKLKNNKNITLMKNVRKYHLLTVGNRTISNMLFIYSLLLPLETINTKPILAPKLLKNPCANFKNNSNYYQNMGNPLIKYKTPSYLHGDVYNKPQEPSNATMIQMKNLFLITAHMQFFYITSLHIFW